MISQLHHLESLKKTTQTISHMMRGLVHPKKKPVDMGVSKNRRTPKWMVKIMENPITVKWMIWRENPLFLETATCAGKFWFCDWKNFVSCRGSNPILPGSPKTKSRMPRRILVFSVGGISVRETPPGTQEPKSNGHVWDSTTTMMLQDLWKMF